MRNTCLLIIICFSFIIKSSFGQQEDFSGQAQLNPYAVNPAAISNTENLQMMLGGSYYLSYVPVNLNLDFTTDARYSPNETGSSFMLRYNMVYEHQYFNSEKLSIGYAYRYGISRNKSISAGISMSHYSYDYDFTIHDISGTDYDKFTGGCLTTSPGVLIKLNRLSISASSRLSFNRKYVWEYEDKEDVKKNQPHSWGYENITIAYKISVSPTVEIEPYIRYFDNTDFKIVNTFTEPFWDYGFGCQLLYKGQLESGTGFTKQSFYLYSKYRFSKRMDVAAMLSHSRLNIGYLRGLLQLGIRF